MKDYKEMTKCVLEARDAYEAKRGKKKIKTQDRSGTEPGETGNNDRNGKKIVWRCVSVFAGLAVAVAIVFIVSDYSVDRPEEETTETHSEATEENVTEEIREEASTTSSKKESEEQDPNKSEWDDRENEGQKMKEQDQEKQSDDPEKAYDRNKGEKKAEQSEETKKITGSTDEPVTEEKKDNTEENPTGESTTEHIDEQTEGGKENATYNTENTTNNTEKQTEDDLETQITSNWTPVIYGEDGITYELDGVYGSKPAIGHFVALYRKYYKGIRTDDRIFFHFDGTKCTDDADYTEEPFTEKITSEMLRTVDVRVLEKNLRELDKKMSEAGYVKDESFPEKYFGPTIQMNKKREAGTSLICPVTYLLPSEGISEEQEAKFWEYFGNFSTGKDKLPSDLTFDLITGIVL